MRPPWWLFALASLSHCGSSDRPPPVPTLFPDAGPPLPAETCTFAGVVCDGQTPYRCADNGARTYLPSCTGARPFCVGGGCVACPP
ncbi:MAG: hypothetical protein JWM10_3667, partial [Myxococcaceae bacterium]|nr:hypothetical protein [Myxococcaceae bacterium]